MLHARTDVTVTALIENDCLSIDVEDHDPRPPVKRAHRADLLADIDELLTRDLGGDGDADERHAVMQVGPAGSIGAGRGLLLVEGLADAWGVRMESAGKAVWFRIDLRVGGSG